ncbi:MAG: hypothetical protein ACFCU4_00845 [Puniceicoccaceae bacterium]
MPSRIDSIYRDIRNDPFIVVSEGYLIDVLQRVDDHPRSRVSELTPQGWANSKND